MIVDRVRQIIAHYGLSERKFSASIGASNGFLSNVKNIGSDKLSNILNTYPEVNALWLITGEGEMLESEKKVRRTGTKTRYR